MPNAQIDLKQVARLRTFKIDYSNVHTLDYVDKNNLKPQTFRESPDAYRAGCIQRRRAASPSVFL